jgi:GTP cyclohydrolase I
MSSSSDFNSSNRKQTTTTQQQPNRQQQETMNYLIRKRAYLENDNKSLVALKKPKSTEESGELTVIDKNKEIATNGDGDQLSKLEIAELANSYLNILRSIGENPNREGLLKTPERAAKAVQYFSRGYNQTLIEVVGDAIFNENTDDMVIVKDIEMYSLCEHHMIPFFGKVCVGYLPNKRILGLSKIPRIIEMFARRLQRIK